MAPIVNCEYCGPCGYTPRFQEMERMLKEIVPNVVVCGCPDGRKGSFEIEVNEVLIHSRLMSGHFPDPGDVVEQVLAAAQGGEPSLVTRYADNN